ncbi:hypothetical protein B0H13DRAFT_2352953 [Mycena leptocephala]|nr:hypothetical protein B0H13DRAFT_2352953 [Mycena leptocephala]
MPSLRPTEGTFACIRKHLGPFSTSNTIALSCISSPAFDLPHSHISQLFQTVVVPQIESHHWCSPNIRLQRRRPPRHTPPSDLPPSTTSSQLSPYSGNSPDDRRPTDGEYCPPPGTPTTSKDQLRAGMEKIVRRRRACVFTDHCRPPLGALSPCVLQADLPTQRHESLDPPSLWHPSDCLEHPRPRLSSLVGRPRRAAGSLEHHGRLQSARIWHQVCCKDQHPREPLSTPVNRPRRTEAPLERRGHVHYATMWHQIILEASLVTALDAGLPQLGSGDRLRSAKSRMISRLGSYNWMHVADCTSTKATWPLPGVLATRAFPASTSC